MRSSVSWAPVQASCRAAGAAMALLLPGCGQSGTEPPEPGAPVSVSIVGASFDLFESERRRLDATVRDAAGRTLFASVRWESSSPTTVTVTSGGQVTALSVGTATIWARVSTLSDSVDITVLERLGLARPIVGEFGRDVYLVNYVDLRTGGGIEDYACGVKSYDGHRGVDVTLDGFVAMDSGVTVSAAAPGEVITVRDGLFDRHTEWQGGGLGNFVAVRHRNGFVSSYGHMRKSSILVTEGQNVRAGDPLGLVGSSGNSDMPHLHFELERNGATADPFVGPCGATVSQWADQLAYQDGFQLIQTGVTDVPLSLDLVKQPPQIIDTVQSTADRVSMWVHLFNARGGAVSRWELFDPSDQLFGQFSFEHDRFYSMSWWWAWFAVSGQLTQPGRWRFDYYHGNQLLAQRWYELVGPVPVGEPVAGEQVVGGIEGGAAFGDRTRF